MRFTGLALTLAAVASAVDLRGYSEGNCGGGYTQCGNVAAGTCCVEPDPLFGAPSIAVVFASPGTQLFGYQRTRDGNSCGAIAKQVATGSDSYVCLTLGIAGNFAAARWYPAGGRKRSSSCAPTSNEKCSGSATPDTIVLSDGHAFDLASADVVTQQELYSFLANGSTTADLPEHVLALEKDIDGLEERVKEMGL